MKVSFSKWLDDLHDGLKSLVDDLGADYEYVSALSTDSTGLSMQISNSVKTISNQTLTAERGTVIRVCHDGQYSEFACNDFDPEDIGRTAAMIREQFAMQQAVLRDTNASVYQTPVLSDEPCTLLMEAEAEILPETADQEALVTKLTQVQQKLFQQSEYAVEARVSLQSTHVNKMFLSKNRDLKQSYVYSEASMMLLVAKDGRTYFGTHGITGKYGVELADELEQHIPAVRQQAEDMLKSEPIEPGEYDIITTPEVSGLIAHEAFGHGVEMDMFVKNRALGKEYIGKRVGSPIVTMHEGALCADDVTSYAFDDEGTLASDVIEIDHGILKTGVCDALAAARLGVKPTGNGKRENYSHKAYSRMTNTIFDSGENTVEEMIASVKHGYLLEGIQSGMEDPKHWGIQCVIQMGKEIKDGKLTGKIVAPVLMTGRVLDVLENVSMASGDREIFGTGACGKGYKEWVKVTDGGPYFKTKGRLG